MSNQEREIKEVVVAALLKLSDATFEAAGFQRRLNAIRYDRKLRECSQSVEFCLEHGPKDNPNAAAAVYPWLSVTIPDVDAIVRQMTGGDDSLLSSAGPTLHQPIEVVAPKGTGARWYIYQPDSVLVAVQEFVAFSTKWLLPFLEEYSSANAMVTLHRTRDERVLCDQAQILRGVAAMLWCREYEMASETLNSKFGRPGMRRRYAPIFEFVEKSSSTTR